MAKFSKTQSMPCKSNEITTNDLNRTEVTEFLLMGFSDSLNVQILHAVLFVLVYLVALMGNLLIIMLTTLDGNLQTPMYYFLRNLSFLDFCYISVTVPKSIVNSLIHNNSISFFGCALQVFFFMDLACTEVAILTVMSYDRYVAILQPLHYEVIMNHSACVKMMAMSWLSGLIGGFMHVVTTFSLPFCGSNVVHQFFCNIPQLLSLLDSKVIFIEIGVMVFITSLVLVCFISITFSYVSIFSTILRIPSKEGRSKTFSTCIPHIIVVALFMISGSIAYVKPISNSASMLDLFLSVFYTVVPPTLNPIIYSLRNKDMKAALKRQCEILHGNF